MHPFSLNEIQEKEVIGGVVDGGCITTGVKNEGGGLLINF